MQTILSVFALWAGLSIAYVDTRPTWDDTGITVGAILIICNLFALAGYRRPWLLALLVGGWIPLYEIIFQHNYGSLIALGVALFGAYAGWFVRKIVGQTSPPA